MTTPQEEQETRSQWFRHHWQNEVRFNQLCNMTITRWDADGVDMLVPYADELSAHEGIFHGGVVAALIDTCGSGAVIAGHDFSKGSRATTVTMTVQYLSVDPGQDIIARGRCTRRGRQTHFAEVVVESTAGKRVAQGLVTVNIAGDRPGVPGTTS